MEIKNKNISLHLNDEEKILYVGQNDKWDYIGSLFLNLFIIVASIIGLLYSSLNDSINYKELSEFAVLICFFLFLFLLLQYIWDYHFREIFLTNQRLIILEPKKLISLKYHDISYITSAGGLRGTPSYLFIKTKMKKNYRIMGLKENDFVQKFLEIYPEYDDSEIKERGCRIALIAIPILLIILIIFKLFS